MILTIIESPYAGDIEQNVTYARQCMRHSLSIGEAPLASHLLYTQDGILDDTIYEDRMNGIQAGLAWRKVAERHVFYVDLGISQGMQYAMDFANAHNLPYEIRRIL